ncbi:MAG: murein hydrolase activator EnvC family protein, partial [Gammaproteobacteria bacterium]
QLERQNHDQVGRRGDAERALRAAERRESDVRRQLDKLADALSAARDRLAKLAAESAGIKSDLAAQVAQLERQIRAAWVSGRDDWLSSVLSQRDPAAIGRQLVYHSYIARQRTALIDQVRADLRRLAEVQDAVGREREGLERTLATERERLAELSDARERRKLALAEINAGIASRNDRVERLRAEAANLEALVEELTRMFANMPIAGAVPFGERKGQLEIPANGKVIRRFGQSRADGRLRWEGILVSAPAGEAVRAVHHGRVVFSDWLPGMGLLVVLEHGDGYLSLYGHNRDLVTEVGEWVDPGTVIAHVGDSGGQAATGLYFEIRKNGSPQNPAPWLAR